MKWVIRVTQQCTMIH